MAPTWAGPGLFVTERAKIALTPEVLAANSLDHLYAGIHLDPIRYYYGYGIPKDNR